MGFLMGGHQESGCGASVAQGSSANRATQLGSVVAPVQLGSAGVGSLLSQHDALTLNCGDGAVARVVSGRTAIRASQPEVSERATQWYAVYTCANHERRIAEQFAARRIEHFLPQYESIRKWKDRKVRLQFPLFPGYLFVHLALRNRLQVQQVPGVVHLVGFNGTPTAIADEELLRIRDVMNRGMRAEPHPFLTVGRRVRVAAGPLVGLQGILVRRKSKLRFVISVELIMRSMAVEMDEGDLEPL
ncbi:MAG TPA: UpxY family transcription antiterminator [Terriglobales bacterium]|nr:UpxY family transcription antiterminator [Terriglobales bacterium]